MKKLIYKIDLTYDKDLSYDEILKSVDFEVSKEDIESTIKYYLDKNETGKANFVYEYILDVLNFKDQQTVFRFYLCRKDHFDHEDIVSCFQSCFYDDLGNIPLLINSISDIPEYLQDDDMKYPYIRKIIYAIGAQPEPNNIEALVKLSNKTEDIQIKELALHQIKKRRLSGRWESVENT